MEKRLVMILGSFALLAIVGIGIQALCPKAVAEPACTDWLLQDNGCYWRTCVGDDGQQFCEQCCPDENKEEGWACGKVKCE